MNYPSPGEVGSNGYGSQGFLPSSAPVSSLLPPIPTSHPKQQSQLLQQPLNPLAALAAAALTATASSSNSSALHHQLAAFLQGNTTPSVPQPQAPQQPQLSHQQLLALSQVQQANWSLDQLEQHVALLQRLQQPIPPNTALLLAEARTRAAKRHAKRVANRTSACTSRARKKALVQEMTELNLRLRRQALILSLLPDMVIAIDPQGRITFCSAQVERVISRSIEHELIGANIADILVPGSRKELHKLVQQLLGKKTTQQDALRDGKHKPAARKSSISGKVDGERKCKKHKSGPGKGDDSEKLEKQAFPLKVVQVDSAGSDENGENSDASKQPPSSLTNSSALDVNSGGSDNDNAVSMTAGSKKKNAAKTNTATTTTSSDSSSSNSEFPSLSASPSSRNLLSANANLERNVRWHNKSRNTKHNSGYKDDVNGAAVTANNASARLSSLQHLGSSSEEDDSGYRESNESREETSSSSSSEGESSAGGGRRRVLAPTCNVCLIRNDLTTIWCEVTSSLRSRETEQADCSSVTSTKKAPLSSSSSVSVNESKPGPKKRSAEEANLDEDALEILLCLRPIHDGESCSSKSSGDSKQQRIVSEVNTSSGGDDAEGMTGEDSSDSKLAATGDSSDSMSSGHKRGKTSRDRKETSGGKSNMDDFAVESLIAMSKSP